MGIKGGPFGVQILLSKLSKMKSFSIFFLLLVSLAVTAAEIQTKKQSFNPLASRNVTAILNAEMAIRSLPSIGNVCRDRFSTAANGTIRPTISNSINGQRQCSFFINAPADKLIQMTCSVVNLKSPGAELVIYGGSEINVNPPVVNRIYTSRSNSMFLFSRVDKTDWFDCKWKMIPVPQTTEYQLCRDGTSATPNGTIQRSADDTTDTRMCMFAIAVPSDHRIQLMCSNVTLSSPDHYLQFQTISETVIADPPAMNRVYTSTSEIIYLFSQFSNQDSFKCQWTTVMIPLLTTDNKLCRDKIKKSASGNIQPLMPTATNVQPKTCSFIIKVPSNQLTEIFCPVVNFTSPGSYLQFSGISDLNMALTPLANRVYTSGVNLIYLNSQIDVSKDWFNCTWSAVPAPSTTDFKLCHHGGTSSSTGTLQPFLEDLKTGEPRECYFFIELPLDEQIEFSCSSMNLSSPGSYLRVVGVSDFDENPPVENGIYLSNGTSVLVYSKFNNGDWFDCMWASTTCPVPVTTDAATSTASTTAVTTPATTSSTTTTAQATTTTTMPSTTSTTTSAPTTSTTTTSTTPQTTTVSTTTTAQPTTTTTTTSTTTTMATTTPLPIPFNFSVSDPVCGSMLTNLTSTGGVVQSPNFPGDYGNNSRACVVTIVVPVGWMIQLKFTTFNLETNVGYVQVDDNSVYLLSATTGNTIPALVPATINEMNIVFRCSDSNKPSTAIYNWQATFSVTSQGTSCSVNDPACGNMCTNVTSEGTGVVQSPNFPADYGKEFRTCIVTIVVPAGKRIRLTFTTFNLETDTAYIAVYDKTTIYLNTVTGSTIPAVVTTSTNIMYIQFAIFASTKPTTATYNWQATYTAV